MLNTLTTLRPTNRYTHLSAAPTLITRAPVAGECVKNAPARPSSPGDAAIIATNLIYQPIAIHATLDSGRCGLPTTTPRAAIRPAITAATEPDQSLLAPEGRKANMGEERCKSLVWTDWWNGEGNLTKTQIDDIVTGRVPINHNQALISSSYFRTLYHPHSHEKSQVMTRVLTHPVKPSR